VSEEAAGVHLAAGAVRALPAGVTTKTIALPKLDGLAPTLESTALKLMEEAGELGAAIGKLRGLSGEKAAGRRRYAEAVSRELLDVAQTAITMMFVLEEQHGISIEEALSGHVDKLVDKGYLKL